MIRKCWSGIYWGRGGNGGTIRRERQQLEKAPDAFPPNEKTRAPFSLKGPRKTDRNRCRTAQRVLRTTVPEDIPADQRDARLPVRETLPAILTSIRCSSCWAPV